jgi:hypothetical protein
MDSAVHSWASDRATRSEARLNNKMDLACKQHWNETQNSQQMWFADTWSVWTDGKKVVSNLSTAIRGYCSRLQAKSYWKSKLQNNTHTIDWDATGAAIKTIPRSKQQWLTKHCSGFCSVGRMAKLIGLRPTDECPRCGEVESAEHVWLCKQPDADHLWENSMEELRVCLRTIQTPITTINAIIDGLQWWQRGENTQFNTTTDAGKAGAAQNDVGWKHFFEGRPHKIWQAHSQLYLSSAGKGMSSKRWVMSIIQKMWEIVWECGTSKWFLA